MLLTILANSRPIGPIIVNNKNVATITVDIGDKNNLTISGIFLFKNLSNLAVTNPIIKAMYIFPLGMQRTLLLNQIN